MKYFPDLIEIFEPETLQYLEGNCLGLFSFQHNYNDIKLMLHIVLLNPKLIEQLGDPKDKYATPFFINLKSAKYKLLFPISSIIKNPENDKYFERLKNEYEQVKRKFLNNDSETKELLEAGFSKEIPFWVEDEVHLDYSGIKMEFMGQLSLGNFFQDLDSFIYVYFSKGTMMVKLDYVMS